MNSYFQNKELVHDQEVQQALDAASEQILRNLSEFTHQCQNHSSVNQFYPTCRNDQWTTGFWPGELWLAYEHTGNDQFRAAASIFVDDFLHRIEQQIEVDHHDMGFLYSPSCVAAYQLTGNETGKKAALLAAENLINRFQEKGAFLQAWGAMGEPENYRYIIDCLMNVPLLYWAGKQTGDPKFAEIANRHTQTCMQNSIRPNHSTYHTFYMNPQSGLPSHGATCQGYKDDSDWARGQAWAVYGTALSYRDTKNPEYLDIFRNVTTYFLSKLPEDLVPYWDLIFTSGTEEPRDSSSASIVICGLLEAAKYMESKEAAYYETIARKMMKSLIDHYSVKDPAQSNGLVLHGTYSKRSPYNTCTPEGVDECVSWGDYFYLEALTRLSKDWNPYW